MSEFLRQESGTVCFHRVTDKHTNHDIASLNPDHNNGHNQQARLLQSINLAVTYSRS